MWTRLKIINLIVALGAAVIAAALIAIIAHDDLGVALSTIRVSALASAAFVGIALAGGGSLGRNK